VHVDEKEEWERYAWEHQKEAFENDHIYYLGVSKPLGKRFKSHVLSST
jgi:hypothetical protein